MKQKNWQDIKNMSEAELKAKLAELEDKYFSLKFRNAAAPVKKSSGNQRNQKNNSKNKNTSCRAKKGKIVPDRKEKWKKEEKEK